MARKRKDAEPLKLGDVRVSLRIRRDEHRKLRALALSRDCTINRVVLDALAPHLKTVRVPWTVVGTEAPGPGEPAEDAA